MRTRRCHTYSGASYPRAARGKILRGEGQSRTCSDAIRRPLRKCRLKNAVRQIIKQGRRVHEVTDDLARFSIDDESDPKLEHLVRFLQRSKKYGLSPILRKRHSFSGNLVSSRSTTELGNRALARPATSFRQPLDSQEVVCVEVEEEEWTHSPDPTPCSVLSVSDSRGWVPHRGGLKVAVGAVTSFHCWRLSGTMAKDIVHVFGVEQNGSWHYVTAARRRLKLQKGTPPSEIDVDNGMHRSDPRCFYIANGLTGGRGVYLLLASDREKAATIKNDRVVLERKDRFTTTWEVKE